MNPAQPEVIRAALLRLPAGSNVMAATDADTAGEALAAAIGAIFLTSGREDLTFSVNTPDIDGSDWNDVLRHKPSNSFPVARL